MLQSKIILEMSTEQFDECEQDVRFDISVKLINSYMYLT